MSCRRALCQECATTWEGVHYCAACLTLQGRTDRSRGSGLALALLVLAAACLFWAVPQLMVWAGVLLTGLS